MMSPLSPLRALCGWARKLGLFLSSPIALPEQSSKSLDADRFETPNAI